MFTGIVENTARVLKISNEGTNQNFRIDNPFDEALYIDQSISHNGVCLTVVTIEEDWYEVTAISETLSKTNLGDVQPGDFLNLERSLLPTTRMDGHFVQGHVDCTGQIKSIKDIDGSWEVVIIFPEEHSLFVIDRGSICVNGISLTVAECGEGWLKVAIIPYTYHHTNLQYLKPNNKVNLEFDSLGKYVINYMKKTKS